MEPFANAPFTDFSDPANAAAMEAALAHVRGQLGGHHRLVIGGAQVDTTRRFRSTNPGRLSEVIGTFADGGTLEADRALSAAWAAFPGWRATPVQERADFLLRVAATMRARRLELAAWMVLEVGKSWAEADGDVAEAIDFAEFYARSALRWCVPQPTTPWPGESNELHYLPLGAGVAIPPWNFPLAIAVGMTLAPVVAGNTVVLKPAEQSPAIAAVFMQILIEEGLPAGVVNLVSAADGAVTGAHLVAHPMTRFISFTGSRPVGLNIVREAGITRPGQRWIKRVVAEMGGKDAILVDRDADPDYAASCVVAAAFGFQGQKCSACSRVIAHKAVYPALRDAIVRRTRQLVVGPAWERETDVAAVVDEEAYLRLQRWFDIARREGTVLTGGAVADTGESGYYLQPTVVDGVAEDSRVARTELFGPLVALIEVDSFERGVEVFNGTDYGLTGAYIGFEHIAEARAQLEVGNLYINRKCTGALVDVQPFGGFNMSGTDAKAGGREHLLLFLQGKAIAEKQIPRP